MLVGGTIRKGKYRQRMPGVSLADRNIRGRLGRAAVLKVKEGEGIVLEFEEAECGLNKVRVIIDEVALVGLEKQITQIIEALKLDREALLKSVDLKSFKRM